MIFICRVNVRSPGRAHPTWPQTHARIPAEYIPTEYKAPNQARNLFAIADIGHYRPHGLRHTALFEQTGFDGRRERMAEDLGNKALEAEGQPPSLEAGRVRRRVELPKTVS
jgi:hypothetical protein